MSDYEFTGGWGSSFHVEPELDRWTIYENHREIVSSIITKFTPPHGNSLCVLGAGICFDLNLPKLLRDFTDVTLLDLSHQSLEDGIQHQQQINKLDKTKAERIKLVGDCDITGVNRQLIKLAEQEQPIDNKQVDSVLESLESYRPPGLETYDCVASTCVLSQLLYYVNQSLGEEHPRFVELIQAVRKQHIDTIINALKPQGTGLLFTDFVSSDSLPELYKTKDLKAVLATALQEQNYLHGLHPGVITQAFKTDDVREKTTSLQITEPWRWLMPEKIYACFAVCFTRK